MHWKSPAELLEGGHDLAREQAHRLHDLVVGQSPEAELHAEDVEVDRIAKSDELKRDQMKLIRLDDGTRIALARNDDGHCAFQDRCTHRGGSLADGVLICGTVQCL